MIELYLHNKLSGLLKCAELGKSTRLPFRVPVSTVVEVIP